MNTNKDLLEKIVSGIPTQDEVAEFDKWLKEDNANQIEFAIFKNNWLKKHQGRRYDLNQARKNIDLKIKQYQQPKVRTLWSLKRIAAILIVPLLIASLYVTYQFSGVFNQPEISYTSIVCPLGTQQDIVLPDGTAVKLNAGSNLVYPSSFEGADLRKVTLHGEAYFDVTKNKEQPFIVDLGKLAVRVVGTSFNINNYSENEDVEVYLNTGLIDLLKQENNQPSTVLTRVVPQHLATFSKKDENLTVNNVPAERYLSWTKGYLVFEDDLLGDVVDRLARWYQVEIEFEDERIKQSEFTANLKGKDIEQALKILAVTSNITYTLNKNYINAQGERITKIKLMKQ
ncbi:DUF4974 domain-containing protein [Puteibacter caeruleilacunae]|nr:DUF4974 domain-containing protein [Puteibacter caeruleilacunae]